MNQLGYYGKTPHRGDFVRFNLPQSFVNVWDDWLQQVMINGEAHNQTWPALYAQAPTYRFALSRGIAGICPWIGILKASQDKVGRRFPFCLAMSLPEHALPCASIIARAQWFDEACTLLGQVFSADYHFDDLQEALGTMAEKYSLADSDSTNPISHACDPASDSVTISMHSSNALQEAHLTPSILDTVLQQTLGEYSLWIANDKHKATVINAGLPTDNAALALFSTQWKSASTAHLDVNTLALTSAFHQSESAIVRDGSATGLSSTVEQTAGITSDDAGSITVSPLSAPDASPHSPAHGEDLNSRPGEIEQTPSADDWAALDVFSESAEKVIVPDVEPLELDMDDVPDAPWEH